MYGDSQIGVVMVMGGLGSSQAVDLAYNTVAASFQ